MTAVKTAIILHGTKGSPEGNWFRWLEQELKARGYTVWLPDLPHAEQPSLAEWAAFVWAECPFVIDQKTLIVGHSSGAILALIVAQQSFAAVGAVVAVSVFHDNSLEWEPNNRLFDIAFDWVKIRQRATQLLFVHSDDDPYVPLEQAQYVAESCKPSADLVIVPGQGHFNLEMSPEYARFPRLIELMDGRGIIS